MNPKDEPQMSPDVHTQRQGGRQAAGWTTTSAEVRGQLRRRGSGSERRRREWSGSSERNPDPSGGPESQYGTGPTRLPNGQNVMRFADLVDLMSSDTDSRTNARTGAWAHERWLDPAGVAAPDLKHEDPA